MSRRDKNIAGIRWMRGTSDWKECLNKGRLVVGHSRLMRVLSALGSFVS